MYDKIKEFFLHLEPGLDDAFVWLEMFFGWTNY